MTRPRPTREMKKLLRDAGFQKKRQNGSHAIWKHKTTGHSITIVEKGGGRDMSPAMVVEALRVIDEVERTMAENEAWVDINEAAKMLGVSHTTARTLRDRGELVGKKMRQGNKREKWFITTESIRKYKGRGPAQPAKILLSARLREVEKERDELKAQLHAAEHERDGGIVLFNSLREQLQAAGKELEKVQEQRDRLQSCLNNQTDMIVEMNPSILEVLEKLHKRLDSPEVRFLLGHGPTRQEVFESVLAAGILAVQKQLDESDD